MYLLFFRFFSHICYHRILGRAPCANIWGREFSVGLQMPSYSFVEKAIVSSTDFLLHFCKESVECIYWALFLGCLCCPTGLFIYLSAKTTRLDYYISWNWVDWLNLPYFFLKKMFILLPLPFHRLILCIFNNKNFAGILIEIALNLLILKKTGISIIMWSHPIHKHGI